VHEMALMEGILASVRESASKHGIVKITKIKIVIGKLTMVLPDSLTFAFEVLASDGFWQGAELEIEERDVECRCRICGRHFGLSQQVSFYCPDCGQAVVDIVQGQELFIDYFEGEEGNDAARGTENRGSSS